MGTLATIVFVIIWITILSFRLFDVKVKKYIMFIAGCLILLLSCRMIRMNISQSPLVDYLWYLYYFSFLFIPTVYYSFASYLSRKVNIKLNYIVYFISTILFLLVMTNNFHNIVFRLYEDGKYSHNIGYIVIVIWIFILFTDATIKLCLMHKDHKLKNTIIAFSPIIIGLIYTILYDINIFKGYKTNVARDLSFIIIFGLEILLNFNYIPNNFRYHKLYKESNINSLIVNNKGKVIYHTKKEFIIPNEILSDIQSGTAKNEYNNEFGQNQLYRIKKYGNKYAIFKKDFSEINRLKDELSKKNNELNKYKDLIEKEKEIKQKLYEIKIQNEIQENLEENIEDKKENIHELLNKDDLSIEDIRKLKFWIGYCKRISTLIIENYNKEIITQNKLELIINELLEDAKMFNITSAFEINFKYIENITAIKLYEIISCLVDNYNNFDLLIKISKQDNFIVLKILFDKHLDKLEELINNLSLELDNIKYKEDEDESILEIKIGDR